MSLITRQSKGSRLSIEEMDNNLLYLESLSGNTGFTQAKIGSNSNYSLFDSDGSLRFFGSATTYNDQPVDILTEISSNGNPLTGRMFRNVGSLGNNYAIDFYSNLSHQYGELNLSGFTDFINTFNNGVFSMSFWVNSNNTNITSTLFSISSFSITSYISKFSISKNSTGIFIQHNNATTGQSTFRLNADAWYHICYVQKDNTTSTLYINNIPVIFSASSISLSNDSKLFWGCRNFTTSVVSPSFSSLSNLRIYNVELTNSQVSELYNVNLGLSVDYHPSGITESNVIVNFKNLEYSGNTLYNSSTLGINKDIILYLNPNFINGPIGQNSHGVFLPSFDPTIQGTIGDQRSIRFEMSHDWKTGSPIDLHMHISTNIPILSGQTIIFSLERTIQDVSMVLTTSSLNILNSGRTYPNTTVTTYTFSPQQTIPAYTNLILDFDNIDMSQFVTASTSGIMTLTRLNDTFPGSIFEVQSIRMHYEIDSIGSRQMYIK